MNILEAYIKFNKQLIILIIGLPCTNKSQIAKELGLDIGFQIVKINNYLIENKYKEISVDNFTFKVYEDSSNYDYDKLNTDVNSLKSNGVVIYGNFLDAKKIDWEPDFVFFYSMNVTLCKKTLIEKKMIEWKETEPQTQIYFEKILDPIYDELKKNFKINKFFNIKETTTFEESYDEIFDLLMELISKKLGMETKNPSRTTKISKQNK